AAGAATAGAATNAAASSEVPRLRRGLPGVRAAVEVFDGRREELGGGQVVEAGEIDGDVGALVPLRPVAPGVGRDAAVLAEPAGPRRRGRSGIRDELLLAADRAEVVQADVHRSEERRVGKASRDRWEA